MNRQDYISRLYEAKRRKRIRLLALMGGTLPVILAILLSGKNNAATPQQKQDRAVVACGPAGLKITADDQPGSTKNDNPSGCTHSYSNAAALSETSRMKRKPGDPRCDLCI